MGGDASGEIAVQSAKGHHWFDTKQGASRKSIPCTLSMSPPTTDKGRSVQEVTPQEALWEVLIRKVHIMSDANYGVYRMEIQNQRAILNF